MPLPIEQYALIGDCHTAALVGLDGSIDWLCFPRFDSGACFAALLGAPEHGRWRIGPSGNITAVRRKYREGTLILETEFETTEGRVRLTDFMPASLTRFDVVRIVEGLSGRVAMSLELIVRFDYGSIVPWVRRCGDVLLITAGPDTLELAGSLAVEGKGMKTVAEFTVGAGEKQWLSLNYRHSHVDTLPPIDPFEELEEADKLWHKWSGRSNIHSRWHEPVVRSLITLKALQYRPSGGIIAAPTTSLPEQPGGVRNWDYRFCWLRDATFALNALLLTGYIDEATQWREWLLRAVAGSPKDLQILYGVTGVRRLDEYEVSWLPGYQGAAPVRVGNAASKQFQLDVYGEVMDTLHLARMSGLDPEPEAWNLQVALLEFLESHWQLPDDGIWEIRGPQQHFVHSKVMAWVAFDRGIKDAERDGLEAPLERWTQIRDAIHAEVCAKGFDAQARLFRAVLRILASGCEPVADTASGFPAARRSARARHRRRHRAGLDGGWARAALLDGDRCRRTAGGRGRLLAVLVLAGGLLRADRPAPGERGPVRAIARTAQRRGAPRRGVRSPQRAHARKFSAGLDAYGARQYRAIAVDAGGPGKVCGPARRASRHGRRRPRCRGERCRRARATR